MLSMILAAAAMASVAVPQPGTRIDMAVQVGMQQTGAKGLAVALVEDGRVVFQRSYGLRNARGEPLDADTVMYGASLTKTVFAYTVLQLAAEGRLDLDRPIAAMLPRPLPDYGNLDA